MTSFEATLVFGGAPLLLLCAGFLARLHFLLRLERQRIHELDALGKARLSRTQSLEAELQQLAKELHKLEPIKNLRASALVWCDREGLIEWANEAWQNQTGYALEEAKGKKPGALLQGPSSDPNTIQRLREAVHNRKPCIEDILNYRKSGTHMWNRVEIAPLFDSRGQHTGFLGVQVDLSLLHESNELIAQTHERLRLALEAGRCGFWEWQVSRNRCDWDELACKLHGSSTAPLNYEQWIALIDKKDRAPFETQLRSALLGYGVLRTTVRIQIPGEGLRHLEYQGKLEKGPDPSSRRLSGLVRDVTPDASLREELRLAGERLRLALQGANDGVWEWSCPDNTCRLDEHGAALLGSGREQVEVPSSTLEGRFHPEDLPLFLASREAHLLGRTPRMDVEVRLSNLGGDWIWIRWRATVVERDNSGRPLRLCGTFSDVTQQHRTELALRRSALLLRQMCQQMGIAAWEIEAESSSLQWTEELDLLHAAPPDFQANLESFLALYPKESNKELSRALMAALEQGTAFDLEVRWQPPENGSSAWYRWIGTPVSSEGKIQAVCGLIQNVTAIRDANAQRRELDQRLSELQQYETLSAITDDLAYDLNSLLSSLLGFQELACEELPVGSNARNFVLEAMRTGNRTHDIIRQVLLLNRVKPAARIGLRPILIVEEVANRLSDMLPSAIQINRDLDRRCPPIHGDTAQLQQALLALASHAAGALLGQKGNLEFRLSSTLVTLEQATRLGLAVTGAFCCIDIGVTSEGFNAEHWLELFESSHLDPGLHLVSARKILSEHQGVLEIEGEANRGGRCRLWLPHAQTLQSLPPNSAPVPAGHGEAVWIVDEERFIARLAKLSLERNGYQTRIFRSSNEFLSALRHEPKACALLLMGSVLTGSSVTELALEARALTPRLAIVCLGGTRSLNPGLGASFLAEPFTAADLARAIYDALHPSHGTPAIL